MWFFISSPNTFQHYHDGSRYDFDYGSAHFVVISTEHDIMTGSAQYEFIINSLQNVNRNDTPWIIVAGHRYGRASFQNLLCVATYLFVSRPMYTVSSQDLKEQNVTDTLQAHLEPLFRVCRCSSIFSKNTLVTVHM